MLQRDFIRCCIAVRAASALRSFQSIFDCRIFRKKYSSAFTNWRNNIRAA